jgi:hypothetical protein
MTAGPTHTILLAGGAVPRPPIADTALANARNLVEASTHEVHKGPGTEPAGHYPRYLSILKFADAGAGGADPAVGQARSLGGLQPDDDWSVWYQSIGTWQTTPQTAVIKLIGMDPPPDVEDRMNAWYTAKHIPEELDYPGVLGATRYRRLDDIEADGDGAVDYPRYVAAYFYADLPAAEAWEASPQRAAAYADVNALLAETGIVRRWRVRYLPLGSWRT